MDKIVNDNQGGEKFRVLTAGGAASSSSSSTNKNKKKKKGKKRTTPNKKLPSTLPSTEPSTAIFIGHDEFPLSSSTAVDLSEIQHASEPTNAHSFALELEHSERGSLEDVTSLLATSNSNDHDSLLASNTASSSIVEEDPVVRQMEDLYQKPIPPTETGKNNDVFWLFLCFIGIMASFVCYGLLLEYTTSGGRKLHELSFLFVTSGLYTLTAAAGRYVRAETPTTIPPARFAILGLTSMGSTFCSVRSLRYVIYPIQVLAKSCKPVPVMLFGALMGKRYDTRKYINVVMIVFGVASFMGGGSKSGGKDKAGDDDEETSSSSQLFGIVLLFVSLCFDGGTGAYEDKLMSVHSVQPFDLMYNIQLGKTILAGVSLLVLNQWHIFLQMCQEMGFLLVALGLSGAMGQVFIFVTIAKFGALTCSIIGLSRKVTTLVASIYFYGHHLNGIQFTGLMVSLTAMVMNFLVKSKKGNGDGHGGHGEPPPNDPQLLSEEMQRMLDYQDEPVEEEGDVELAGRK